MHNNGWIKNTMLTLTWPHISKDPSGPPGETHAAATLSTFNNSFILLSLQTSNIYSFLHILNWWPYFTEQRESVRTELPCPPTETSTSLPALPLEICSVAFCYQWMNDLCSSLLSECKLGHWIRCLLTYPGTLFLRLSYLSPASLIYTLSWLTAITRNHPEKVSYKNKNFPWFYIFLWLLPYFSVPL